MASHNNVARRIVKWEVEKTSNGVPILLTSICGTSVRLVRCVYHGRGNLITRGGKAGLITVHGSLHDAYHVARVLTSGEIMQGAREFLRGTRKKLSK